MAFVTRSSRGLCVSTCGHESSAISGNRPFPVLAIPALVFPLKPALSDETGRMVYAWFEAAAGAAVTVLRLVLAFLNTGGHCLLAFLAACSIEHTRPIVSLKLKDLDSCFIPPADPQPLKLDAKETEFCTV